MKFIPHLGKFEDLETFDTPFEFQSKMNPNTNERIEPGSSKDLDDFDWSLVIINLTSSHLFKFFLNIHFQQIICL